MKYLEIFIAVAFFCLGGVMTRLFQLKIRKKSQAMQLYQFGYCLVAAIVYFIFSPSGAIGMATLLFGIAFGLLFAAAVYFSAECYDVGPMSLTSLIMNLSLAIPLVYSLIFFHETITPMQMGGLVLLVVTFILSAFEPSSAKSAAVSMKWLVMVFIAFAANGLTALIQKQHNTMVVDGGKLLFIAYLTAAVCFLVIYFIENKGEKFVFSENFTTLSGLAVVTLLAGIGNFFGNGLLGGLSVKVDAAILYPSLNGGLAILTSVVSFILFSEKITRRKLVSLAVGVTAIVLLAV